MWPGGGNYEEDKKTPRQHLMRGGGVIYPNPEPSVDEMTKTTCTDTDVHI
jgi:hypothetical protein